MQRVFSKQTLDFSLKSFQWSARTSGPEGAVWVEKSKIFNKEIYSRYTNFRIFRIKGLIVALQLRQLSRAALNVCRMKHFIESFNWKLLSWNCRSECVLSAWIARNSWKSPGIFWSWGVQLGAFTAMQSLHRTFSDPRAGSSQRMHFLLNWYLKFILLDSKIVSFWM